MQVMTFMKMAGLIALCLLVPQRPVLAETVTIVSFNVENLFDTINDPDNPHDNTYLPVSIKNKNREKHDSNCEKQNALSKFYQEKCKALNWDELTYQTKLKRLGDTIKAMPELPDVIVLQEIENKQVLDDLINQHLDAAGYQSIQLDTSDKHINRGIDVGFLTKLPLVGKPEAHKIDFGSDREKCGEKTRDIVSVPIRLSDEETLIVYGVHFPSGRYPMKCRFRSIKFLNGIVKSKKHHLSIAAGDFNINCNEAKTGAFKRLLIRGKWWVSPVINNDCRPPGSSKYIDRLLYNWPTWSFLDMIIVSDALSLYKASKQNWFADLGSFGTVVVHPEQITVDKQNKGYVEPRRFDPETGRGVSDHWPVMIRLLKRR